MDHIFIKRCTLLLVMASFFLLSAAGGLNIKPYKLKTIVIDAGHGGKDPGCLGKVSRESIVSLAIAKKLGSIIEENLPDVKVVYTRKDNTFVELHDRAGIANKNNASLFVSIHCNSAEKNAFGTETYTMGLHTSKGNLEVAKRENSVILQEDNYLEKYDGFDPNSPLGHILFSNYQSHYIEKSLFLASKIESQFQHRVGRSSRGVKQAGLLVLWKSAMPSVLVEVGFLTNPGEELYLNDDLGQTYMSSAIYRAIRDYKQEIEKNN